MTRIRTSLIPVVTLLAFVALHVVQTASSVIEVNDTCTLARAIGAANNDDDSEGACPPGGSEADTLVLTGDVSLYEPLPRITTTIIIDGHGFTIERAQDAGPLSGFYVAGYDGGHFTLENATVRNFGTAITTFAGTVNISNSTLSGNSSGYGGAIYNQYGTVTIDHSTLSDNSAQDSGGAIRHFTEAGSVVITNSTLSNNSAGRRGGAIDSKEFYELVDGSDFGIIISNSTLVGNSATRGGAIYSNGRVTLTNATLSGNSAHDGGAIEATALVDMTHSTVIANTTTGLSATLYGPVRLSSSIVAGNAGGDCFDIRDGGNNFDSDGSCTGASPIRAGVDFDTTLADNGGYTMTHALLPGSVAQNAAGDCGLETDQRGVPRNDGSCDSGSFELATGACCLAPNSQRVCVEDYTAVECEAERGLYAGDATTCEDPLMCDLLLVTMDSISAIATDAEVEVLWTTTLEIDTVAFRVLRETGRREKALQVVANVAAAGNDLQGHEYSVLDDAPEAAFATHYYIEDIDLFGKVTRHGPVAVERGLREERGIRVAPRR